jgi:hypothetical protein
LGQLGCASASFKQFTVVGPQGTGSTTAVQVTGTSPAQYYTYLTWTPSSSQYGPNIVCAALTDTNCMNSPNHCYTVLGGIPIPMLVNETCTPSGGINTTTLMGNLGILTWAVNFNSVVMQPQYSAYIRYFYANGTQMFKIDVSSFPSVTFTNLTTYSKLSWETGNNFPDGGYYILFDYGVGLGPDFCLPQSEAVTDKSFCSFFVRTNDTTTTTTTTLTQTQPTTVAGQTLPVGGQSSTAFPILPVGVTTTTSTTTTTITTTTVAGAVPTTTVISAASLTTSSVNALTSSSVITTTSSSNSTLNSTTTCTTSKCNAETFALVFAATMASGIAGHLSSMSGVFFYLMKKKNLKIMDNSVLD